MSRTAEPIQVPSGARWAARPRLVAILSVAILAGLGWIYLGLMMAGALQTGAAASLGPGMGLLDLLGLAGGGDGFGRALVEVLCRPTFGSAGGAWDATQFALVVVMWSAMALAMMLPTAGAMILAYAEIAATAARKGESVVSPVVLTAGYAAVWLGFALAASLLQWGLARASLVDPAMASASPLFSGAVFIGAGLYQFSGLKHACVTRCQRPFPFFFSRWTDRASGVFRLGLRQGVYCLGCCGAMMLAMFAVGVMNVVWMAALGTIMAIEKLSVTTRFSRAIGVIFIAIGAAFIVTSVIAQWPARA